MNRCAASNAGSGGRARFLGRAGPGIARRVFFSTPALRAFPWSRARGRISLLGRVALLACALVWLGGCYSWQGVRIDPTGERIFTRGPLGPMTPIDQPQQPNGCEDIGVCLQPAETVAPVGDEVVLVASALGPDGHMTTNRRLEWTLAEGSVGHFVAVGEGTWIDLLTADFNCPRKVDNTFVIGNTSRRYLRLTRGTPSTQDDVYVLPGQGWVSLSSPVEGTSYVTVYIPAVANWQAHKETAVVHWVDAQWQFPPPTINPAGGRAVLTTSVMHQSDQSPCVGWLVRYEILDGPPAGFAPQGARVVEVPTDSSGRASVEIFQTQPAAGTNQIRIQVIRPPQPAGPAARQLLVGTGTTSATWSAPGLAVYHTGPAAAGVGTTIRLRTQVSNPGDLPVQDVVLTEEVPAGLTYLGSNPPAEVAAEKLQWRLGQLGPGEVRSVEINYRAAREGSVTSCAEATAAGGLNASHCTTINVSSAPPPVVQLSVSGPQRAAVGSRVQFEMAVTNRGTVPTGVLLIKDHFDPGLQHDVAREWIEATLGELQPGETKRVSVTFTVAQAGTLCHEVHVLKGDQVLAKERACVEAVAAAAPGAETAPPVPAPTAAAFSVTKTGPDRRTVGQTAAFVISITNTGTQELANLRVVDTYDAALKPTLATEGHRLEGNSLVWTIDRLPAGTSTQYQVHCECLEAGQSVCNRVAVSVPDGTRSEDSACLTIQPATSSPAPPSGVTPGEPPGPSIPPGTTPGQAPGTAPGQPSAPPGAPATGGARLNVTMADLRDPVAAGREVTYDIRVTNQGTAADDQVVVAVEVPAGLVIAPLGTVGPGLSKPSIEGRTVRFDPTGPLGPGESIDFRVRVQTQQAGQYRLRASVTSRNWPQPVSEEETTEVF